MDLFAQAGESEDHLLGYRMQKLEVYNWGTFDQDIWTMDMEGKTSLLTGDVGSGKSTLVDAVLTLLVPPRKVTYNKAADASARERSLTSYVRGYYGQSRTEEGGSRPEALRGKDSYSVILGVFADRNFDSTVTLAQVFWFPDEQARTPKRFYVLARRTLEIARDFSRIGVDMRSFRKRLERDSFTRTFDDYPPYGHEFRKAFGIRQSRAMDLFQQTVSMKKVDSLTDFVRANMLEVPEADEEVDQLLRHYHDLEAAHQAVERARRQEAMLEPIELQGGIYEAARQEAGLAADMQFMLGAWFAKEDYRFRESALAEGKSKAEKLSRRLEEKEEALKQARKELDETKSAMSRNGGEQLRDAQAKVEQCEEKRAACRELRDSYEAQAGLLGMELPSDKEAFAANRKRLSEMAEDIAGKIEELGSEQADYRNNLKENEKQAQQLQAEIRSLEQRKSNIPREFVEIRGELCKSLGLAEQEMPFAGELMAVREEEYEWEGALERLLHGFGVSLLVPEVHYGEVTDWIEHRHLGLRLIYFRVPYGRAEKVGYENLPEEAACRKLEFSEDSPLRGWLEQELADRFSHLCCESLSEFRQAKYALSKAGQIKTGGRRHEKDDRHRLEDRRHYVLGFSNLRKIQLLKDELEDCENEQKFFQSALRRNQALSREFRNKETAVAILSEMQDFARLDLAALEAELSRFQERLRELTAQNDIYNRLKEQAIELEKRVQATESDLRILQRDKTLVDDRNSAHQNTLKQDKAIYQETEAKAEGRDIALLYELLTQNAHKALTAQHFVMDERVRQKDEYADYLRREADRANQAKQQAVEVLAQHMTSFRTAWPELVQLRGLVDSVQTYGEYTAYLKQLREDDLPRFEGRFHELLKENTINQIALFHTHLENTCQEIEERIEMINASLAQIDYNEGRYIQIECHEAPGELVRAFRSDLRACTDDALSGTDEATYSKEKFEQVTKLVERLQGRPGQTEIDAKWRKQVTDVRNWYSFAASERWRETGEEYEHYTDSGGKSGGQKEKLAYTILAASIVYNFGLEGKRVGEQSFRFVVIDEAFLKSSDDSARFGLELFKKLDLQLLVVTPLLKLATIEPYVRHVGFVYLKDEEHRSYLRNLTIEEVREGRAAMSENTF